MTCAKQRSNPAVIKMTKTNDVAFTETISMGYRKSKMPVNLDFQAAPLGDKL